MSFYMLSIIIVTIVILIYNRYFPVRNIPCMNSNCMDQNTVILDIRDYNESKKEFFHESVNIPYGYLKRYYHEISQDPLHVVAANQIELNLGLRFLIKKGFNIVSFEIINCPCKKVG